MRDIEKLIATNEELRKKLNIDLECETNRILRSEMEELENSFFTEKEKKELKNKIEIFLSKREEIKKIEGKINGEFIEEYINAYHQILTILWDKGGDKYSGRGWNLLGTMLLLDYDSKEQRFDMYSPFVLEVYRKMQNYVEQYYANKFQDNQEILKSTCINMIWNVLQKKSHIISNEKGELLYGTYSVENCNEEEIYNIISFKTRKLSEIDSYYPTKNIGIVSKIKYEMSKFLNKEIKKGKKEINFKIAILGKTDEIALEKEISVYIEKELSKKGDIQEFTVNSKINIVIDIYAKDETITNAREIAGFEVKTAYFYNDNQFLQNKNLFDKVLEEHHCIFILDNLWLYEFMHNVQSNETTFFLQDAYFKDCIIDKRNSFNENIWEGLWEKIYDYATLYYARLGHGYFRPRLREYFIEELIRYIKEDRKFTAIYMYNSFYIKSTQLSEFYKYIHTEEVGYMTYGVLKLSSCEENLDLQIGNQYGDYISFSVWELIEAMALKNKEIICHIMKEDVSYKEACWKLSNSYICIDYSNWKNEVYFVYNENDIYAKEVIENIILPLYNSNSNVFRLSLYMALNCVLRNNAQSIKDLIFMVWLKEQAQLLIGKARSSIIPNIIKKERVMYKNYVEIAISENWTQADHSLRQVEISHELSKIGPKFRRDVFSDILVACEQMDLKESYLYRNIKKKLLEC